MPASKSKSFQSGLIRWVLIALLALVVIVLVRGYVWASSARQPLPQALAALESDAQVKVAVDPWYIFSPKDAEPEVGFIFYPGGRVDARSYAPLMKDIAAEGYLVVVPSMVFNMAVFSPNRADAILDQYTQIDSWAIGGHSLGGVMAAQYTFKHPGAVDGLALWASFPSDSSDLSGMDLPVISIYGTLDPSVGDAKVAKRKHLLPVDTVYVRIEGGDHNQFGAYETEPEEDFAAISREAQHAQIVEGTLALLERLTD